MSGPGLSREQLLELLNSESTQSPRASQALDHVHPVDVAQLTADIGRIADPVAYRNHVKAQLNNDNPHMSTAEDMARSAVTGSQRGLTGIAGSMTGYQPILRQVFDAGANITSHLLGDPTHAAALKGKFAAGQHAIGQVAHAIGPNAQSLAGFGPTTQAYDQTAQHYLGAYHQPQTVAGRYAQALGEMLPNAVMPGGLAARAARVVAPALASQTAAEVAPDKYKDIASLAGAVAGGGAESLAEGIAGSGRRVFGDAARSLTPGQAQQAAALREAAANRGVNLTVAEAVQQVTNGGTGLGRVQRLVENSRRTAPQMQAYFAPRPGQVRNAVEGYAQGLAPDMGPPGMVGLDAQRAGMGAQIAANNQRLAASRPYYAAADAQAADPAVLGDLLRNIDGQIAGDQTGLVSPVLGRLKDSLSGVNDLGNLSTARNYWRDLIDLPPTGQDPLTKYQAGILAGHLDTIDDLLKANPNRALGDAAYADASRNLVDPLNAGPVGKIAATEDLGSQTGALYPRNPPVGAPAETAQAIGALNSQDADIAAALTRHHIQDSFNQSTRNLTSGPNQYGGAKWVADILGNREQAATLHAGLNAVDPSGQASADMQQLGDILAATGKRERPGSMTAFNQEDQNALKLAPAVVRAFGGIGDPLEWTKNISNATGGAIGRRNLDVLASLLTNPDTLAALQSASTARGGGVLPQLLAPAAESQGAYQ